MECFYLYINTEYRSKTCYRDNMGILQIDGEDIMAFFR